MKEVFLQFLWKWQLLGDTAMRTTENKKVKITHPGELNTDAGPDFLNAKIEIDRVLWAGNVEIHHKASDWYAHKHHEDPSYKNVILHVVLDPDREVLTMDGRKVAAMEMEPDTSAWLNYERLIASKHWLACKRQLHRLDQFSIKFWLGKVLVERLEKKTSFFLEILSHTKNDWTETFYQGLARSFGFKVNALPFEMLARSLPFKNLQQLKGNHFQIEAIIFGQSGLLDMQLFGDDYYEKLKKEYRHLKRKYSLKPLAGHLWKFMRLRPQNFPTIRLAQFASLINQTDNLFSTILETRHIKKFMELFEINASPYWHDHYQFNKISKTSDKTLGKDSRYSIIINTVVPFLFLYGKLKNQEELRNRAIELLEELPPEKNSLLTSWDEAGVHSDSAFYSQALIHLSSKYCKKKNCLECEIGNRIISYNA